MVRKDSQDPHRPGRPYVVPPALLRTDEPFDGHHILDEVQSPLGVILWETVRDVMVWAATPAQFRYALFGARAFQTRLEHLANVKPRDDLGRSFLALAEVLAGAETLEPRSVAQACLMVSRWAQEEVRPRTAIWYAQAAALVLPTEAESALTVAQLLRGNAEYVRAETWFRRAIGLARRRGDARIYALSFLGLGNLFVRRGDYARGKAAFEHALRAARRAGIRTIRAEALHDLFATAAETRQVAEAESYARMAYRAYPASHSRLPALAHDVAVFWMLQGYYARALPVLRAVAGVVTRPIDRLVGLSNLARAAGGAAEPFIFATAWVDTWQIIDSHPTLECVTSSLVLLAYGSALIGDWERVELAARYAVSLATERGEESNRHEAQTLLDAWQTHRLAEAHPIPRPEPGLAESADALAEEFVRTLTARAGSADSPRMQC